MNLLEQSAPPPATARRITVSGRVQGVGFRPFVYRLAHRYALTGWVRNRTGLVEIHAEGAPAAITAFAAALTAEAPPLAQPELSSLREAELEGAPAFAILASAGTGPAEIHLPPDMFCCDDCLAEIATPGARRYRYPFTNCTQCGPRYTIIAGLPYDRARTAMAGFPLCPDCRAEFDTPEDRRFHAQPLACPVCGPQLRFTDDHRVLDGSDAALEAALEALREGAIVAVRGVGGYHLMCDAADDGAVRRLRARKHRPDKPLAVLFPPSGADGLGLVRRHAEPTEAEAAAIADPVRPIVLVTRRAGSALSPALAPGLTTLGVLLPYSPLHYLLAQGFGAPLVATSGNLSGEPVITDPEEAEARLGAIADAFLHHDRPILRPADDSVVRVISGAPRPLRLGRGLAPLELDLPADLPEPVIAAGGHMKGAVALAWGRRVVVSPHIGALDSPRAREVFAQVIADLCALYDVTPRLVICDANPSYASTRWARDSGLALTRVDHHVAHASALAGEYPGVGRWLTFVWDGAGLGPDGTLWGGEAFLGAPGHWRRVASLRPFDLLGPDRAARAPWRSAAALLWGAGMQYDPPVEAPALARRAWDRRLGCFTTSSAGRLFDAAAALILDVTETSFEGQGPMMLESLAEGGEGDAEALPLVWGDGGLPRADWAPLLPMLRDTTQPPAARAARFHEALARTVAAITAALGDGVEAVGLTGGVFQNRRLAERITALLGDAGIRVHQHERLPAGDGGLAYGQIIEALHRAQDKD